ncbi:MAG: hypothetical protein M1830_001427 [Pleopsidium flavum]|nr:MAG: hypothetical protein M1830_001427 [Pleopsidium flavum]
MRELRQLKLPQLVEARKKEDMDTRMDSPEFGVSANALHLSQSSTSSDYPSPVTPTFSLRGHSRFPSSTSSLPSSPVMCDTVESFGSGKRPLTDVKEEPHERDEDFAMLDNPNAPLDCFCDGSGYRQEDDDIIRSSALLPPSAGYDLTDGSLRDVEFATNPPAKKRRAGDSPLLGMASRLGTRFPSFSQKWKIRKTGNTISVTEGVQDADLSGTNSIRSRSSSKAGSIIHPSERRDFQFPPTPTKTIFDEHEEHSLPPASIDIVKANRNSQEEDSDNLATTPLLPPLMVDFPAHVKDIPVQSPLQSPTVADASDSFSTSNTPTENIQLSGLPSPPLSSKPSVSSFHRQRICQPATSSDLHPIIARGPADEWADKLGHANFNIYPQPYIPDVPDTEACKQMRADWDLARCNYMKHLVRTGEHYGVTSKIYKLTEEKWAVVDLQWKKNSELLVAKAGETDESVMALSQNTIEPAPPLKMPSLNDPRSDGKFPKLGDEDIVGPMVQIASQFPHRPSKKAAFFRFLRGVLPSSVILGRSSGEKSS